MPGCLWRKFRRAIEPKDGSRSSLELVIIFSLQRLTISLFGRGAEQLKIDDREEAEA
jgi:hypothetical protein